MIMSKNGFYLRKGFLAGMILLLMPGWMPEGRAQVALTLDKSISIAGLNSPDIQRSLLNLTRYRESLNAQRASLKSKLSMDVNPVSFDQSRVFDNRFNKWFTNRNFQSFGTFRIDQPIKWTDGTVSLINRFGWQKNMSDFTGDVEENESFTNRLYLSYNQPLFTYNRMKLDLRELELNYENANISYALQKLNLEKNVTRFFYNVYLYQMSLDIAKAELENTQRSYEIIKRKVEAGLSAKEELFQAELNLATARSSVENKKVDLENAKDEFKRFLGMNLNDSIVILADITVPQVEVDLEKAVQYGLDSRMELRQREIDIESSQFQLVRTKAMNEFKGNLGLAIGIMGDDPALGQIYDKPTNNPSVALSFRIPLFDWGEKKARIRAQEAVIESQQLNFDEEKKQIIIDIRKVYRNLRNDLNQITIAKKNVQNAELTYEINLERYRNGDLTSMDLNLFQNQLSQQKMSYAQALINYKLDLLDLKIQTLYDFEHRQPIVPEQLFLNTDQQTNK